MNESKFQLREQRITKIKYNSNKNFDFDEPLSIDYDIKISQNSLEDGFGIVTLDVGIFNKKNFDEVPFVIEITIEGEFDWNTSIDGEELNMLLNVNAPAVLFSYLRPFISQITLFSGNPPLVLPLIDFTN